MTQEETERVAREYYVDGRIETVDEHLTLAQLQAFVEGYIEIAQTCLPRHVLVINEEGTLENLPINLNATAIVAPDTLMLGGIRGDALLIKDPLCPALKP
jgi:hypothetical protein